MRTFAPIAPACRYCGGPTRPFCATAAEERKIAVAVEREVEQRLPKGKAQRAPIAKALGMSERTLCRRLAVEGTTFDEVVDQLRRNLALRYLWETDVPIMNIAMDLGYEGSVSFQHAFRRWTGYSPTAFRKGASAPEIKTVAMVASFAIHAI